MTMKKYLIIALAFSVLFGAFLITQTAYATQHTCPPPSVPGGPGKGCVIPQTSEGEIRAQANEKKDGYKHCAWIPLNENEGPLACMRDFFAYFTILQVQLLIFFVGLAGAVLNLALSMSFTMGEWAGRNEDIGKVIALGWTIFRDLGNLALIAGLIWASIAMILQIKTGAQDPGKLVVNVIIVALLVNFSYFFAGALIDASNSFSRIIYVTQIKDLVPKTLGKGAGDVVGTAANPFVGDPSETSKTVTSWLEKAELPYIGSPFSEIFLHRTRIISIIDPEYMGDITKDSELFTSKFFTTMFFAIIIFGLTVTNFVAIAVALITRLVLLIILLITAPVMVLKFTGIQLLGKWGDHWWGALSSQLVFLPVFVVLSLTSFKVIGVIVEQLGEAGTTQIGMGALIVGLGSIGTPDGLAKVQEALGLLMTFALAWGFLWASRKIALDIATQTETQLYKAGDLQKMSGQLGDIVGKTATKIANVPRNLAMWGLMQGGRKVGEMAGAGADRAQGRVRRWDERHFKPWRKRVGRGVRFWDREGVEEEKRAERRVENELGEVYGGVADWEERLRKAKESNDATAINAAEQGLANAKSKRDQAINNYHEVFGPVKTAARIRELGDQAYQAAYQAALKAGKSREDAHKDGEDARYKIEDGALKALGDNAPEVKRWLRASPKGKGAEESGGQGGGSGTGDATALAALTSDARRAADGIVSGNAESLHMFQTLDEDMQGLAILARKDLVVDRSQVSALKRKDASGLGKLLVKVAGIDPGRLSQPDHAHLADHQPDMARHMTPDVYASLRAHYGDDAPIMRSIRGHMRREGTGKIIDDYKAQNPSERV